MTASRRQLAVAAAGAVVVTVLCLVAAAATGAAASAGRMLLLADPSAWGAVLTLMIAVAVLRYLRLRMALPGAPPLDVFNGAALHGSAGALAPGKLGELVLPVVVRRLTGSSLLAGAGLLVFFRFMDFAALIAMTAVAGVFARGPAILLSLVAASALAAPFILQALIKIPTQRDGRLWSLTSNAVEIAGRYSPPRLCAMFALTLTVWAVLWAAAFAAAEGAGGDAPAAVAGLALASASAAFASPVNGIASAGPFEGAFAGVFVAFGHDLAPALAAAVLLHVCAVAAPILCLAAGEGLALALRSRAQPGALH